VLVKLCRGVEILSASEYSLFGMSSCVVLTFLEKDYLSANGNYWCKLSDMLHEIIKIKI